MPTTPYDSLIVAINAARGRLNDSIKTLYPTGGQILGNTQPFSQQMVNNAFRKMQGGLADLKYSGLEQELAPLIGVPPCFSADPLTQVRLDYAGYFDGSVNWPAFALPQTLIRPYQLWERQSGSAALMTELDEEENGLPSVPHLQWNRQWEWRDDALYLPGATVSTDIRMRYAQYFADFADNSPTNGQPWYNQPIPILRCVDSFADYICREFEIARQSPDAAMAFQASAEDGARKLAGRDTAQPTAVTKASELGKMRDRYTPKSGATPAKVDH